MRLDTYDRFARNMPLLNTPSQPTVHQLPRWKRALVWPLAFVVRLWTGSLRLEMPDEDRRVITSVEEPTLFILWHNRLFMAAEISHRFRAGRPLYSLISASRDGSWLEAYFQMTGLRAVRGSSSRRGREAATALVSHLRSGKDAGITPDGPRGPIYELKAGGLVVARAGRCRVVLVGADFESAWRLPSWDGFYLPRPFSTVHLRFTEVDVSEPQDRDEAASVLAGRLRAINPDRKALPTRR